MGRSAFRLSEYIHRDKAATVLALSQAARQELEEWARTPAFTWNSDGLPAQLVCMMSWMGRPLGFGTLFCRGPGFWREYARLGAESRIQMLLTIARFDADCSGDISAQELADYHKFGEALVASSVAAFQNFGVIFTLLIGATHQTTISRPSPYSASALSVELFGADAAEGILVAAYALNVLIEVMCMTTLMCCIFLRFLLTNTLTTLDAKLTYMVQSNGLANVAWTAVITLFVLFWLMIIGGVLGQPRLGFIVVGLFPVFVLLLNKLIARWYCESIKRLHAECVQLMALSGNSRSSPVVSSGGNGTAGGHSQSKKADPASPTTASYKPPLIRLESSAVQLQMEGEAALDMAALSANLEGAGHDD